MKTRLAIFEELLIWMRGRFTLTDEEKLWMLIFLIIVWTGLLGRYFYLQSQTPELLSTEQVQELPSP